MANLISFDNKHAMVAVEQIERIKSGWIMACEKHLSRATIKLTLRGSLHNFDKPLYHFACHLGVEAIVNVVKCEDSWTVRMNEQGRDEKQEQSPFATVVNRQLFSIRLHVLVFKVQHRGIVPLAHDSTRYIPIIKRSYLYLVSPTWKKCQIQSSYY